MSEIVKKEVCKCTNCGNESEMTFTCSLEDQAHQPSPETAPKKETHKVKGTATCTHCGNEADMWIDI